MLSEAYLFFSGSVATLAETSSQQGTAKHQLCQIYTICTLWYMEITFTNQDSRVPFSALWFSSIANSRGGGGNFPLLRWNTLIHWLQCCNWSKWLSDAAGIRSGCSANQVKAHSTEVLVRSNETAELQSLQTPCHLQQPQKRRKNVSILFMMTSASWGERSSKQFTAKRGGKQQCDVGSNKLTNSIMLF